MDQSIIRITKEISDLQKNSDLSIAVACRDVDVRSLKALIIGPHETPYEFGFFEFSIRISKEYPSKAPLVQCITTNDGRTRFNPNIYANGKVCLSILGTWQGEKGEEWSSAQGLESILLSIQSLMSSNPYVNEPGFEEANGDADKKDQQDYRRKIRHETLRISVVQRLENYLGLSPDGSLKAPPSPTTADDLDSEGVDAPEIPFEPFKDLCKQRFLWYYESYCAAIREGMEDSVANEAFPKMPFEQPGSNSMDGKFQYPSLRKRLLRIKEALDAETIGWVEQGLNAVEAESRVAVNLQHQFEQLQALFKQREVPHSIALEGGNPFVWTLTYIGGPMTNLDGGLFRIKIYFSPRFPDEQPRARFESKLFHHHIAPDGTACYTPDLKRREDVQSHIQAIIAILEDEEPAYDPRTIVNPEASKLFWGKVAGDRKMYSRMLRRSVQESMENFPE